jgi:hypothetical protein
MPPHGLCFFWVFLDFLQCTARWTKQSYLHLSLCIAVRTNHVPTMIVPEGIVDKTPDPALVAEQAGEVAVDIGNAAKRVSGVAANVAEKSAYVAAEIGQQAGQAIGTAINSDEAKQVGAVVQQGAVTTGRAVLAGGQSVTGGLTAIANSEEAAAAMGAVSEAGGATIDRFKSTPVPQMNFDMNTAKKTMGAASVAVSTFFFDIMQVEIVRDFFQFLGTMVDNINMPPGFRAVFGNVASFFSVSLSYLLEFIKTITAINWYFIFAVAAFIPWLALVYFMRRDLNLDVRFAATREAKNKLSWKRRNEKGKMPFYVIKATILACTTLYAPVTRNCLQMIAGHQKYFPVLNTSTTMLDRPQSGVMEPCSVMDCADPNYNLYAIISGFILIAFTFSMPFKLSKVIKNLMPKFIDASDPEHPYANTPPDDAPAKEKKMYERLHGKNIWYNDEGEPEEFTDALYAVAVKKAGGNPYVSLYSGYEQNWANYKLWVMGFKVLQMLPVIFIPNSLGQSIGATAVMVLFAGFSFYASPFINPIHDKMDLAGRVTLVLTPLILIFSNLVDNDFLWSLLLNLLNGVNMVIMCYFTLSRLPCVKSKLKSFHGSLEFSDPHGGPLPYEREGIPQYDLNLERRRRLWKPFWDNLFATDPALRAFEEVNGKPKRRKEIEGPGGVCVPYPQTRLEEILDKLHHRGRIAFENALLPVSSDELNFRTYLQDTLEGVDCYCTDQWRTVSGVSICKDGHIDSKTKFGRLEIEPYPFSVKFFWDGVSHDWGEIFPWTEKAERVQELYEMNMLPKVLDMKQVRLMLRGMAQSEHKFNLVQHRTEHRKVSQGKDANGNTKHKTITIHWTYTNGKVKVKGDYGDNKFEQGFNVSMFYDDGVGKGSDGNTYKGSYTFGPDAMGVNDTFDRTTRFNELCNNSSNKQFMDQGIQAYLQELTLFKGKLKSERVMTQWALGWGFWYWVYNNDVISREQLNTYFLAAEQNPAVKNLPNTHAVELDCLFNLLGFFNISPVFATWYTYWDDIWRHNQDIAGIKKNEASFSSLSPTSICFRPMPKEGLVAFLKALGNPLGKGQEKYINLLFQRISELEQAATEAYRFQVIHFAQPVVNSQCVKVVKSYPTDPALIEKFGADGTH